MAVQDPKANERKRELDRLAGELLALDQEKVKNEVLRAMDLMQLHHAQLPRVVVCGGAGSGKTTFSETLAHHAQVPSLCLDEYIPGGWTPNHKEYRYRFVKGLGNLWNDLPRGGWVIEHVEACHPELIGAFMPRYAILVERGMPELLRAAEARNIVSGSGAGEREMRALNSALTARRQYEQASGDIIGSGAYWKVKQLSKS